MKTKKRYICKEPNCNNEISRQTALNGGDRCWKCYLKNSNKCNEERHKKHYCKENDCNNEISYWTWKYGQSRCKACSPFFNRGEKHPSYKHGRYCKDYQNYCKCGKKISPQAKRCRSCAEKKKQLGKNNCMYKPIGSRSFYSGGYKFIKITEKKWKAEHIYKVEKYLNRKTKKGETVHHINGIRADNRLLNLYLFAKIGLHASFTALVKHKIINKFILKSNLRKLKKRK